MCDRMKATLTSKGTRKMAWLSDNLGTIIISLILLLVVGLVIYKMISDKRKGKSSCGCGCSNCPSSSFCHSKDKKENQSTTCEPKE